MIFVKHVELSSPWITDASLATSIIGCFMICAAIGLWAKFKRWGDAKISKRVRRIAAMNGDLMDNLLLENENVRQQNEELRKRLSLPFVIQYPEQIVGIQAPQTGEKILGYIDGKMQWFDLKVSENAVRDLLGLSKPVDVTHPQIAAREAVVGLSANCMFILSYLYSLPWKKLGACLEAVVHDKVWRVYFFDGAVFCADKSPYGAKAFKQTLTEDDRRAIKEAMVNPGVNIVSSVSHPDDPQESATKVVERADDKICHLLEDKSGWSFRNGQGWPLVNTIDGCEYTVWSDGFFKVGNAYSSQFKDLDYSKVLRSATAVFMNLGNAAKIIKDSAAISQNVKEILGVMPSLFNDDQSQIHTLDGTVGGKFYRIYIKSNGKDAGVYNDRVYGKPMELTLSEIVTIERAAKKQWDTNVALSRWTSASTKEKS